MDPMSSFINSLPAAPSPGGNNDPMGGMFAPAGQQMFGASQQPQQQVYAQPVQQPVYMPAQQPPMQPQQQQLNNPQVSQPQPGQQYQQSQQQPQISQVQPGEYPFLNIPTQIPQQPQQQQPDTAQILQSIQESIQGIQQPQQQQQQPGDTWPWPDLPKSWQGLQQGIERTAEQKAQSQVNTFQQQLQEQATQQQQANQQYNQQMDYVEGQLQAAGIMPVVTNPSDPNDPGRQFKAQVYGYMASLNTASPQSLPAAAATIKALHANGQYFDMDKKVIATRNSQRAAAFAPIAGGAPTMGPGGQGASLTSKQLATSDMGALMSYGMQTLQ